MGINRVCASSYPSPANPLSSTQLAGFPSGSYISASARSTTGPAVLLLWRGTRWLWDESPTAVLLEDDGLGPLLSPSVSLPSLLDDSVSTPVMSSSPSVCFGPSSSTSLPAVAAVLCDACARRASSLMSVWGPGDMVGDREGGSTGSVSSIRNNETGWFGRRLEEGCWAAGGGSWTWTCGGGDSCAGSSASGHDEKGNRRGERGDGGSGSLADGVGMLCSAGRVRLMGGASSRDARQRLVGSGLARWLDGLGVRSGRG